MGEKQSRKQEEKKRDKMSQSLPNEMCNYFIRVKDRAKISGLLTRKQGGFPKNKDLKHLVQRCILTNLEVLRKIDKL